SPETTLRKKSNDRPGCRRRDCFWEKQSRHRGAARRGTIGRDPHRRQMSGGSDSPDKCPLLLREPVVGVLSFERHGSVVDDAGKLLAVTPASSFLEGDAGDRVGRLSHFEHAGPVSASRRNNKPK